MSRIAYACAPWYGKREGSHPANALPLSHPGSLPLHKIKADTYIPPRPAQHPSHTTHACLRPRSTPTAIHGISPPSLLRSALQGATIFPPFAHAPTIRSIFYLAAALSSSVSSTFLFPKKDRKILYPIWMELM